MHSGQPGGRGRGSRSHPRSPGALPRVGPGVSWSPAVPGGFMAPEARGRAGSKETRGVRGDSGLRDSQRRGFHGVSVLMVPTDSRVHPGPERPAFHLLPPSPSLLPWRPPRPGQPQAGSGGPHRAGSALGPPSLGQTLQAGPQKVSERRKFLCDHSQPVRKLWRWAGGHVDDT